MLKARIAVFVSGGGTNLQALLDAEKKGVLKSGTVCTVIASNREAYALKRAEMAGVAAFAVPRKECAGQAEFEEKMIAVLEEQQIDLIVLAGFLTILSEGFIARYRGRMINIHPSLIPSFCGKGFYGLRVHEAALEYGVKVTGATVHYVNEVTDGGEIILQKAVTVRKNDTPQTLQKRVMEHCEWYLLPRGAELVSKEIIKAKRSK